MAKIETNGTEASKLARAVERLVISEIATTINTVIIILKIMYIRFRLLHLFKFLVLQMTSKQ